MSDIYTILSKHFHGESSQEEEQQVEQFKFENPEEYQSLQTFWTKKEINLNKFDSSKAWQDIARKAEKPQPIAIYRYLKIAASVAAIFLLISVIGLKLFQQNEAPHIVSTSEESIQKIVLDDGSIVYLNEGASLQYPEKFNSKERNVTLKGEAFFEVAKDAQRPFRIQTNHSTVEVLGTSFNIDTDANQTEVSVATGKVKVASLSTNESTILTPNQSALVQQNKLETFATKNLNYQTWKTGVFHFKKTPIHEVVKELNTYYENQIVLTNKDADCLLSTSFEKLELKEILEIIQLSCNLKLNKKNEAYELH